MHLGSEEKSMLFCTAVFCQLLWAAAVPNNRSCQQPRRTMWSRTICVAIKHYRAFLALTDNFISSFDRQLLLRGLMPATSCKHLPCSSMQGKLQEKLRLWFRAWKMSFQHMTLSSIIPQSMTAWVCCEASWVASREVHPPLNLVSVNNAPATARPDKTLAVEFTQGQCLDTLAEIAPGNELKHMSRYSIWRECLFIQALASAGWRHFVAYLSSSSSRLSRLWHSLVSLSYTLAELVSHCFSWVMPVVKRHIAFVADNGSLSLNWTVASTVGSGQENSIKHKSPRA